jgi:hypothetical protein
MELHLTERKQIGISVTSRLRLPNRRAAEHIHFRLGGADYLISLSGRPSVRHPDLRTPRGKC